MSDNSKFLMDKEHYMVNHISLGIAVRYLCQVTNQPFEYWVQRISKEANLQCNQLTPQQIEKSVQAYLSEQFEDDEVYE
ncbi:hypothetical protein [Nostoc sp. FACHB-110]|uniref:hypothetical protein n=1 Tax=Nostoc sp. FACHB-110 TaxID=2692834 RepID=UPI001683759A|nr:hypothetical protein [Nostoc sp. FACHB-110]MBD2435842.1 hypothetical protein [Nostoc sp. FACHB-110]